MTSARVWTLNRRLCPPAHGHPVGMCRIGFSVPRMAIFRSSRRSWRVTSRRWSLA